MAKHVVFLMSIGVLTAGLLLSTGCGNNSADPDVVSARDLKLIEEGREYYLMHGCAVCHGKEGRGDGLTAERFYPRPINLHDPNAYLQGNTAPAIRQSIKNGIRRQGSAMPKYDHLPTNELNAIAKYLESLQKSDQSKESSP